MSSDPDSADAWDDDEDDLDGSKAAARQANKAAKKKAKKEEKKKARAKAAKIKALKLGDGNSSRMPSKPGGRTSPTVGSKPLLSPALSRAGFRRRSEMGRFFRGNSELALDSKRTGIGGKNDDAEDNSDGVERLSSIDDSGDEEDFDVDDDQDDPLFNGSSGKGPRVKARIIVSPRAKQRKHEGDDSDGIDKKKKESEEQRWSRRLARRVGPYGRAQTFDIRDYRAKWVEQQAAAHGDFSHAMAPSRATTVQTAPSLPPPSRRSS